MSYFVDEVPVFFAVPLAVQPPADAAHLVVVTALRLSTSFTMALAAGRLFCTNVGGLTVLPPPLLLAELLLLASDFEDEQPARAAVANDAASTHAARVLRR